MIKQGGSLLGGVMLIAGTTIGGGMLALPVLTSVGGFGPSLLIYFLCWAFMASTGLLFVELCSWMSKESNIITMARLTLGKGGEIAAWALYLFLFYSLTLAYVVGCGDLFSQLFSADITRWMGSLIFVLLAVPFVFIGPRIVTPLNMVLMVCLGVTYFAFVIMGSPQVDINLLKYHDWPKSLYALPIAFTAFAYQGTVPTLFNYLGRSVKRTRQSVIIGSLIPLIAYIIWQWLILGIVPVSGEHGLLATLRAEENAVMPLKYFLQNPSVYIIGQCFAFFAIVTSFFGVTLGLLDFLADGLRIDKTAGGKVILCLLMFVPPLTFAYFKPNVFLSALDYAGGIGCALLLGLLPVLMVWSGRYRMEHCAQQVLPGGRLALVVLILFVALELICEFMRSTGEFTI